MSFSHKSLLLLALLLLLFLHIFNTLTLLVAPKSVTIVPATTTAERHVVKTFPPLPEAIDPNNQLTYDQTFRLEVEILTRLNAGDNVGKPCTGKKSSTESSARAATFTTKGEGEPCPRKHLSGDAFLAALKESAKGEASTCVGAPKALARRRISGRFCSRRRPVRSPVRGACVANTRVARADSPHTPTLLSYHSPAPSRNFYSIATSWDGHPLTTPIGREQFCALTKTEVGRQVRRAERYEAIRGEASSERRGELRGKTALTRFFRELAFYRSWAQSGTIVPLF